MTTSKVAAKARKNAGLNDASQVSPSRLETEVAACEEELNREIQQHLNNGGQLDLQNEGHATQALVHLVTLRAFHLKGGKGDIPRSASVLRRTKFEDGTLSHHRDRMVHHLNQYYGN